MADYVLRPNGAARAATLPITTRPRSGHPFDSGAWRKDLA